MASQYGRRIALTRQEAGWGELRPEVQKQVTTIGIQKKHSLAKRILTQEIKYLLDTPGYAQ